MRSHLNPKRGVKAMTGYRTDLAMERTVRPDMLGEGVHVEIQRQGQMEITWVRIDTPNAAQRIGKPEGIYWTMTHPMLPYLSPEERMPVAREIGQILRLMLPPKGDVLVLGLGNRHMTADSLGSQVVESVLVTRHLKEARLRSVCAFAPGVLGVTGVETAELACGLAERLMPAAVIVVDALAAMETQHIGTTVQLTDTGIRPGSGVGNHRVGINRETLHVPVIAMGIPMVVYASTIVRDALRRILSGETTEDADTMAESLSSSAQADMVVTPRSIDELVDGLADMLALAINLALQPDCSMEELTYYLH